MKGIMLQGTSSDVGKSVLCTALCKLFSERGMKVAPFKSQNMSNNSYVTVDGKEIGRAQGVQAEAAKVEASVYMNPILLKPKNDCTSEVIRFGIPYRSLSGKEYRQQFYELGLAAIDEAVEKLSQQFDYLVVEGAGSPVEINLNDREIVNMKVAETLDFPVILVADIDRGGVFASIVGTLQLLTPAQRDRVVGIIVNKFRGDLSLFQNGVEWLENYTGKPILGVIPFMNNLAIEAEDSLAMPTFVTKEKRALDLAVIKLPYVANFTDLEPLRFEEDVSLRFVGHADELGNPDAVIIPGTKSTISDLKFLKTQCLEEALLRYASNGGRLVGICGGYQMMGQEIIDKAGTDTGMVGQKESGLKLFPTSTLFEKDKQVKRSQGFIVINEHKKIAIEGFEIHLGQTKRMPTENDPFIDFIETNDNQKEGIASKNGKVIGTYFHNLFHNDQWRHYWLNQIRKEKQLEHKQFDATHSYEEKKQQAYVELGRFVEEHLNVNEIIRLVDEWGKR